MNDKKTDNVTLELIFQQNRKTHEELHRINDRLKRLEAAQLRTQKSIHTLGGDRLSDYEQLAQLEFAIDRIKARLEINEQ